MSTHDFLENCRMALKYLTRKQHVFQKITGFVEKFKGVGGQI